MTEEGAGGPVTRTIDYTYDAADRLIAERITDPLLGSRTISYAYDPVGNRLTKTDNGVTTSYTYDDNDRLLAETPLPEGAGGGFTYTYDNNGNMLTKSGNGENWQVSYNALNQVTGADITTPSGGTSVTYQYDHDGIRLAKTVNGTDVTRYLVDKNRPYAQVLEEQRSVGGLTTTTSYVYGDDLLSQSTAGIPHYYLYDGMGSVRGLTDHAGNLTDAYIYDAYGNWLDKSGDTRNAYGYRGEQYDDALEAYYLRARYYQPGSGRFMTTDPLEGMPGDPISAHRYLYGYSNPVNNIDPSGKVSLQELTIGVGIGNAILAIGYGALSHFYEGFGEELAKILPDAGLLGVSGSGSLRMLTAIANITGKNFVSPVDLEIGGVVGGEIVFSIASAQYGLYLYAGWGPSISSKSEIPIDAGVTLYHGWVWNLWNTDDYLGNFDSFAIGVGPYGGINLFKDSKRSFKDGPFGIAFAAASKSIPNNLYSMGMAWTTYGERHYLKLNAFFGGTWEVAGALATVQLGLAALSTSPSINNPIGAVTSAASFSWSFLIAKTKGIWNKRLPHPSKYSSTLEYRQDAHRPPGFTSNDRASSYPVSWHLTF